jgi:hypothetical protein
VHAVEYVIVEMTCDQPLRSPGAVGLLRTGAAVAGCGLIIDGAILARYLFPVQGLACRTDKRIGLGLIGELGSVEQTAATLVV